jgi:E3 ubiquitin-protein ligase listerin
MGGKPKQQQRTKGNLKPAKSSNFNVENSSIIAPFDSSSISFGITEDLIDYDHNVDETFLLVLRKMGKKDSMTKIKALKEFVDLVNESEVTVVESALQMFARNYVQLSTDIDSRVREGAQNSLLAIVNKIGKNLALILKIILPSWICSQYDTYPPASSKFTVLFIFTIPINIPFTCRYSDK